MAAIDGHARKSAKHNVNQIRATPNQPTHGTVSPKPLQVGTLLALQDPLYSPYTSTNHHRQLAALEGAPSSPVPAPTSVNEPASQPASVESAPMALDPVTSLPLEPEIAVVRSSTDLAAALRQGVPFVEVQNHLNIAAAPDPLTKSLMLEMKDGVRHIRVRRALWSSPKLQFLFQGLMPRA